MKLAPQWRKRKAPPRQTYLVRYLGRVHTEGRPQKGRLCGASKPATHAPGEAKKRQCAATRMPRNGPQNGTLWAFNNWLGERRLSQEGQRHLDDVSRLRRRRRSLSCATRRDVERSGRSCRAVTLKEMKTLWAHSFSQRPRFEQVVGYLERNKPLALDQGHHVHTRGLQPAASAAHSPEGDSRKASALPLTDAPRRRKLTNNKPALHHGPSAQRGDGAQTE